MKPLDSTEKKTLLELLRMFEDPAATEKRYARYQKAFWAGAFVCAVAAGVVGALTQTDFAEMLLLVLSGVCIGLGVYLGAAARQVTVTTRYCALDVAAARERLSEKSE